jgi:DNA polymerase-3 subunit epsilon/ATP-dependent DNA helicase DinG
MLEYAAVDLETTGLDPLQDRVIEVGAVAFTSTEVVERMESLVDPRRSVPHAVLQLTGIQAGDLAGAAEHDATLRRLADFLRGRLVVGHGATLDVEFLAAAGLAASGDDLIDTLDVARILLPGSPSHSLPALAGELGLVQPRPHRALDDADATRQLLLRLRERAAGLGEGLKEAMLGLVAPYPWAMARFFAEALTAPARSAEFTEPPRGAAPGPRAADTPVDDPAAIAALLEPGGPLAAAFPGYELREAQRQMLLAVAQTMHRGGTLVVEAGTGTGKTLAYLLPAISRALAHRERVVVSTHTHTLQDQLVGRDIPALRDWLPWDFEACVLKGRASYISLRRWRHYLAEPCSGADELRFKLKVLVWLHSTQTGDRSELRLQGGEEVLWAGIASDALDCLGYRCTSEQCFVHRARAEAERADLVVVNHALLVADAAQGGRILPEFEHLVVDEAHHLEDAATHGLREEMDGDALLALFDRLATPSGGLLREIGRRPLLGTGEMLAEAVEAASNARERVAAAVAALGALVASRVDAASRRDETVRLTGDVRAAGEWPPVEIAAGDAVTALAALNAHLGRLVDVARDWQGEDQPDAPPREVDAIRLRLEAAADLLGHAVIDPDPSRVSWVTLQSRTSTVVLRSTPVDVGPLLENHVFAQRRSVVLTSASLAVGGSFTFFRMRVGLEREPETLILESPFDYLRQALVCLPVDMPELHDAEFDRLLPDVIAEVALRVPGGTLALFTSHQQLRDSYDALKLRGDLDELLILGHGIDGQRRQVLQSFVDHRRSLLLGAASFWEGVDLPGDDLSAVVVVRLPFPVPTEPVFAARAERVRDPFLQYALPQAALRLKQGFGRLIRRSTDRGVVVVLDPRISTRDYGRAFLEVLPPAARYQGPVAGLAGAVESWLRR